VYCKSAGNVAISNCVFTGCDSAGYGGGINFNAGSGNCTVTDCTFSNNCALFGAGIACRASGITIVRSTFIKNLGKNYGYGIGVYSDNDCGITISNCTFSGNMVTNDTSSGGPGVYVKGTSRVVNCRFTDNWSTASGAMCLRGTASAENCTLISNSAQYSGAMSLDGNVTARNCLIAGTLSTNYGSVWLRNGATLENCTIVDNSSKNHVGGVYCYQTGLVVNCVIYSNTLFSGAVGNWYNTQPSSTAYTNCCTWPTNDLQGTGNITNNPVLVDYATGNYRLTAHSPCMDAGLNQNWMIEGKDLDGNPRLDRWRRIVDMGCYEHIAKGIMFSIH